ncbi:MAG: excinuclease ABC subunit UvrC [bacterium]
MSSPQEKLKRLPNKPGVYLFKDKSGAVIYVGKAKSLRKRVGSYFKRQTDIKTTILISRLADIDYILAGSELDALILENQLIKQYKPRYNIALRDDKSYPYLKLTINETWPRLFLTRRRQKDGALYFGRFQGGMVREIIKLVKKLFPIRWCVETPMRLRQQDCLYSRIGVCSAPCIGSISKVKYRGLVRGIVLLLEGRFNKAIKQLEKEMSQASKEQDYERAAELRDRVNILNKLSETIILRREPAPRQFQAIAELQGALKLKNPPMRIEAFDISNIQGSNIVGAMVAFLGGSPLKSDYRKFKIKSVSHKANDVAAIYEIVNRRYNGPLAKTLPWPDLVLIDGGLAQVNSARKALAKEIPIIGLAKKEEEIYFPGRFKSLCLPKDSQPLKLLQRIRNEVHRFAIAYHRQKRKKSAFL